jgi:hypothetical protein
MKTEHLVFYDGNSPKKTKIFICLDRMAPLVSLQKKVYTSILRKELPKLLALSSSASNHQSLQNMVY